MYVYIYCTYSCYLPSFKENHMPQLYMKQIHRLSGKQNTLTKYLPTHSEEALPIPQSPLNRVL